MFYASYKEKLCQSHPFIIADFLIYDYEVPGILLFQAYPCTYIFKVHPLSRYAFSPTMLLLLETFLELLLWNSFQCLRHNFWMPWVYRKLRPFKADFIFGRSQKPFGAKSGE